MYSVHIDVSEDPASSISTASTEKTTKGWGELNIEEFHNPYLSNIVRTTDKGARVLYGRST
jgi:hypothetical protein